MDEWKDDVWAQAWREMPHRRVPAPPIAGFIDERLNRLGPPIALTISQDPPAFCERVWRASGRCPICGKPANGAERLPASLHPTWANGLSVGIGVWVHRLCFEDCPDAGEPAPIPW